MSYLLDSHVLLWWLADSPRIGRELRRTIADPEIRVLVSAASVWEIGIKQALGKLDQLEVGLKTAGQVQLMVPGVVTEGLVGSLLADEAGPQLTKL